MSVSHKTVIRDKIGKEVIKDIERKIKLFPNPKQLTIEKVLITAANPTETLEQEGYFHNILTIDKILKMNKSFFKNTDYIVFHNRLFGNAPYGR